MANNEWDDGEVFSDPDNILGNSSEKLEDKAILGDDEEPEKEGWSTLKKVAVIGGAIIVALILLGMIFGGDKEKGEDAKNDKNSSQGTLDGINVDEQVGVAYIGSEQGSPANGTGAILAFDYQYYVKRDGAGVLKHFNPNNTDYSADYVQNYINKIPSGTQYQLSITPIELGEKYNVILTVALPGAEPVKYNQQFSTMKRDGRYFVKEFSSREIQNN